MQSISFGSEESSEAKIPSLDEIKKMAQKRADAIINSKLKLDAPIKMQPIPFKSLSELIDFADSETTDMTLCVLTLFYSGVDTSKIFQAIKRYDIPSNDGLEEIFGACLLSLIYHNGHMEDFFRVWDELLTTNANERIIHDIALTSKKMPTAKAYGAKMFLRTALKEKEAIYGEMPSPRKLFHQTKKQVEESSITTAHYALKPLVHLAKKDPKSLSFLGNFTDAASKDGTLLIAELIDNLVDFFVSGCYKELITEAKRDSNENGVLDLFEAHGKNFIAFFSERSEITERVAKILAVSIALVLKAVI